MKKTSVIYAIYIRTATFCGCSTVLVMFAEVYRRRDNMEHVVLIFVL
jgi:hypothetical protein